MIAKRWLVPVALAVAVLQIGFLASMIAGRAAILRNGQEVVLAVRPVDPRDLLRGDYVILTYNISTLATDLFEEQPAEARKGSREAVFVRLRPGENGVWQAVAARYGEKPHGARQDGDVDIRGVSRRWRDDAATLNVVYGVERFYVPEGEGGAIERDMNVRPFRMTVAVDANGAAQIKSFHDGETMLYAEPLY